MSLIECQRRHLRIGIGALALIAGTSAASSAQDSESWIGKRFIVKYEIDLPFDRRISDPPNLEFTARGSRRRSSRIYRVELVNDDLVWIRQENGSSAGWIDSMWLVPYDQAIDYYSTVIRWSFRNRAVWMKRGLIWMDQQDYNRAIFDFGHAISLYPTGEIAWANRGNAYRASKQYALAIADYDEAIRLEPKYVDAHYNRAVTAMILRKAEATAGFKTVLDLENGQGNYSPHALILGTLTARQKGNEAEARTFLDRASSLKSSDWPLPIVKFLQGELDEPGLLALATDDDRRTEIQSILGLDHRLKNQRAEALNHFRWVRDHGVPSITEYDIVMAELDRLGESSIKK